MAVDFGKLNRAGLGASSFGTRKTTGTSAQATKNLANSSVATKSSLFSFKGAPRTNFVPGRNVSQNMHKYNYQGMRASLNSGAGRTYAPSHAGHVHAPNMGNIGTVTYNNQDYQKGMVIGQAIVGGIGLLNQLGAFDGISGGVKSSSLGDKLSSALSGSGNDLANYSAGVSSAISGMSGADNSIDLRGAIANANGALDSMDSYAQNANFEANYNDAIQNKTQYKTDRDEAKKGVGDAKNDVSQADNSVKTTKASRDNKLQLLKNADAKYGQAVEAHTQAVDAKNQANQNLQNAETTLANTPKTITVTNPDGTTTQKPNPAYAEAERARDAAKQKYDAAVETEDKAKRARDEAKQQVDSSNKAVQQAEAELDKQQGLLDKAKDKQTKAQTNLKDAEAKFEKADTKFEEAKANIDKYEEYKQDRQKLVDSIAKQEKRLEEMIKKEQEEYNDLTAGINKKGEKNNARLNNIDTSDGMNLKEKWNLYKANRTNNKMEKQLDKKEGLSPMLADSQYVEEMLKGKASAVVNGENYYTGTTPSGQTVYYRGNSPITEEMYKAATGTSM